MAPVRNCTHNRGSHGGENYEFWKPFGAAKWASEMIQIGEDFESIYQQISRSFSDNF